ncbi:MAG TPA: metal-dependent transcriptional regulator [Thermoplasmata archaeon]|nr:metal-dependent transcriptional regulator [Thermoplasmata archaeon]
MEVLRKLTRRQVEALQAVLALEGSGGPASLNAIARSLRVTPPSALAHLTPLEQLHLVMRHRGKSRLTSKGRETLLEYRRHHRIAESLFGRMGMSPDDVCAAASEVDLALSHRTVERLCDAEGHPSICPHGEPIPPCPAKRGAPA